MVRHKAENYYNKTVDSTDFVAKREGG